MTKQKKFITCDGNQAAAHISYMFSPRYSGSYQRGGSLRAVDFCAH